MSRRRSRPRKKDFAKKIVTLVVFLNILFTAAVLYVFMKTGNEPMTLVGCWFAFTTGELWMLSSIKKSKVKEKGGNEYEDQLETEVNQ